ncbi:hypothetical protein SAMN04487788_2623 [Microbacterium testaceum StLB037]|uniref:Uncharacterized protein n=1 Tax=Microbacterium testaceum (strain StLB037) TaxID=979556 RepID=A0A1H0R3M2_MICTS|nr:hypothetical protein SAMN04487788_2623 [Microbacterium testaceum StLB037]
MGRTWVGRRPLRSDAHAPPRLPATPESPKPRAGAQRRTVAFPRPKSTLEARRLGDFQRGRQPLAQVPIRTLSHSELTSSSVGQQVGLTFRPRTWDGHRTNPRVGTADLSLPWRGGRSQTLGRIATATPRRWFIRTSSAASAALSHPRPKGGFNRRCRATAKRRSDIDGSTRERPSGALEGKERSDAVGALDASAARVREPARRSAATPERVTEEVSAMPTTGM